MSMNFFANQLEYIAAVTRALNALPTDEYLYVHVELREEGTGRKIGQWSDEISNEDWSFEEVSE
jgi:hypothetical protein